MNREIRLKIEELKESINKNIAIDDELVFSQCEDIIKLAKKINDNETIAFGYVWRADHFFYVHYDLGALANELSLAGVYIDEGNPNELLEKYYTLFRLFYENSFDIQSAFLYCLKALDVAEYCKLTDRIVANYGTIGTYYHEFNCYEEALAYTKKAISEMYATNNSNQRMLRLLLANAISFSIKLKQYAKAKKYIDDLSSLNLEEEDFKIYIDYANILYYAAIKDNEKALKYLDDIFKDDLLKLSNLSYIIEILQAAFNAMLDLGNQVKAKELLDIMEANIKDDAKPLLELCSNKIAYYSKYSDKAVLAKCYEEFYRLYNEVEIQTNELKARGLHAKVQLMDAYFKQEEVMNKIEELRNQVNYDELTEVYNRRYLEVKRNEFINNKNILNIGYVIVDLDYFKEFNDGYGHVEGDKALILVATCLSKHADDTMIVSRYGGDEFVVLCYNTSDDKLRKYVQKVREELYMANMQHNMSKCSDRVSCSVGYGVDVANNKQSHLLLFDKVDEALYKSKQTGRNAMTSILEL